MEGRSWALAPAPRVLCQGWAAELITAPVLGPPSLGGQGCSPVSRSGAQRQALHKQTTTERPGKLS